MKKAPAKSTFAQFKPFWDQGKNLFSVDPKISFSIQNFAVNSIFAAFKQNSSALSESEKKDFEGMIRELAAAKKQVETPATAEEYNEFLVNMFSNVDDEDRHGEVTMKTSASFKLVGELIDVFSQWGPIPDEWAKKSNLFFNLEKYCKFKAVDIFKCLKAGTTPKRGGPKDEEDEISKELNSMALDQPKVENKDEVISSSNNNINGNLPTVNTQNIEKNSFPPQIQPNPNSLFDRKDPPVVFDSVKDVSDNNSNIQKKNIKIIAPDINSIQPTTSIDLKKNNSILAADFHPDTKLSKKLDFSLPVKFKGIEYFRLCDIIKKQLDIGQRELNSNKLDKALAHAELAYYYLDNIAK